MHHVELICRVCIEGARSGHEFNTSQKIGISSIVRSLKTTSK